MFAKSSCLDSLKVRTNEQQDRKRHNIEDEEEQMVAQIKSTVRNAQSTLLQDAIGAAALIVMLIAGLHLPGLV